MTLIKEIQSFLDIQIHRESVPYKVLGSVSFDDYERQLIQYLGSEKDAIKAFLFLPKKEVEGVILVHHQHHGQQHLGKSEVSGIMGDPFQFFCPELAKHGFIALAPDSICFEDRRTYTDGLKEDEDKDFLQQFNQMCYRILKGTTLMKQVIEDSSIAISLLAGLAEGKTSNIGILGHSYGGNTVLFHSPFDERITHSCSSGAVCSYRNKMQHGTSIEMAEVIPGFVEKYDIEDLLMGMSPRKFLIMSADQDKYAKDAGDIYQKILPLYKNAGVPDHLVFNEYKGKHGLNQARFERIIQWFVDEMN